MRGEIMATKNSKENIRPPSGRIKFVPGDFEVMDITLDQIPELRICAGILKATREAKLKYPVRSTEVLATLLPKGNIFAEGHQIGRALVERYMREEYFPIANERELIARCYVALMACRNDVAWAARAPAYAETLLKEYEMLQRAEGGK
jgi:hypothetical protein